MTEQQWQEFLERVTLVRGVGDFAQNRACIMSACVAKYRLERGEELGAAIDNLGCVCPTIRRFAIRFNDSNLWESDEDRTKTLLPFVDKILNTRGSRTLMERRAFLATDYAVRRFAANAMEYRGFDDHAKRLRELGEIKDIESAKAGRAAAAAAAYAVDAAAYAAYAAADAVAAVAAVAAYAAADAAAVAAYAAAAADAAADAADAAYDHTAQEEARAEQKRLCVELLDKMCAMKEELKK